VLAVLVVASLLAAATAAGVVGPGLAREPLGDPARDWLPGDAVRVENERALTGFYGNATVKANVLVFEGDLTDPAAHAYISAVTSSLLNASAKPGSRIVPDTLKDIPFAVAVWTQVKDGLNGQARLLGGSVLGQVVPPSVATNPTGAPQYPTTREGIQQAFDDMHASPLHAFEDLLLSHPDDRVGVTVFSVNAPTPADARAAWDEVQAAVRANDAARPAGMQVHVVGSLAQAQLYDAKQLPWIPAFAWAVGVATAVVALLVALADWRAGLAFALVTAVTASLWFGALALLGLGLSLGLALPLVFVLALAGRHALVLARAWRVHERDARAAFAAAGKGVLFASVATLGAFVVFTQVSTQSGREMMVATSLAVGLALVVTLLATPIVLPVRRGDEARGDEATRSVPVARTLAPQEPAPADAKKRA
jgi:hypothetical protein